MKKPWKALGWTVLFLTIFVALLMLWYRQASLPATQGKLQVPGLHQVVEIVRDGEGIPHIFAANARDAWFALGYVHAQDRLWQMEMNRRIAAGRVAEILGPNALGTDRFLRTLGIRRNAEQIWQRLAPDTQAVLTAYADGVNAWLAHDGGMLPPEFLLTGAARPEPWQPADSIAWQTMMAWDLGANWTQEILRMRLAQRLTLEQINAFLPPYPGDAPLPTRDYTTLYRSLHASVDQLRQLAALAPPSGIEGAGSNNWVVSGKHTKSGKPLLANDPHLGLSAPALWYFAHISAPGLAVIGATLPGLPGVVLGRNQRIAWGFTNTAPDVQDLFLEQVHPDDPSQYRTPDGWQSFDKRREVIKVKGQDDVTIDVRQTRHGPVITGALPLLEKVAVDPKQHVVAFAWTALRPDDLTIQGGLRLGSAANWEQFLDAARDFHSPQQNIVYADVDGNIGFVAPGRVPLRKPANDLHGLAPAPGWDARYDWDGFIPFDQLPRSFNPPSHAIATANEKIVDASYPHFLTSEWSLPYRAQRIQALLATSQQHDIASFARMQQDDVSLAAVELLPLVRKFDAANQRSRDALALLDGWNGEMSAHLPQPLIFNAWMRELARRIFEDELGKALLDDYFEQRNVHAAMVHVLQDKNGQSSWCRDTGAAPASANANANANADCSTLLAVALDAALAGLTRQYGDDMAAWRWGDAHLARSEHRPFSRVPWLARWFDVRVPSPGDTYTINVGRYNMRDAQHPFHNRHAASLRAIYDLGDMDNSRFMHSTGQSGNVLSTLYRSFVQRWAQVEYVPMSMKRSAAEQDSHGTLTLNP